MWRRGTTGAVVEPPAEGQWWAGQGGRPAAESSGGLGLGAWGLTGASLVGEADKPVCVGVVVRVRGVRVAACTRATQGCRQQVSARQAEGGKRGQLQALRAVARRQARAGRRQRHPPVASSSGGSSAAVPRRVCTALTKAEKPLLAPRDPRSKGRPGRTAPRPDQSPWVTRVPGSKLYGCPASNSDSRRPVQKAMPVLDVFFTTMSSAFCF